MVDLTPLDRLTRKRNMQLQKQLDVRLQIMQEEYRMTKKDLDKNSREISEFLMSLRHTAPGLGSYGQPDTKAMNAKNIMLERRYLEENEGEDVTECQTGKMQGKGEKGRKTDKGGGTRSRPISGKSDRGGESEDTLQKPTSATSSRNEFFNRRIVLDSKRRSFMQHNMEKHSGLITKVEKKQEDPRFLLGGAVTHAGFLSNRETRGEMSRRRPKTATPRSHRPETPRYGRDAYSEQEQSLRQHVLNRFDVIFDPQNEKPEGKIRGNTPSATPVFVPRDENALETRPSSEKENKQHQSEPPPTSSAKYILNRRVAWSAPPKRREDPISIVAKTNNAQDQGDVNRQSLSVTPRSGTAHMARAQQRPNSVTGVALQGGREFELRMHLGGKQNPKNNRRPGTAPPNYELKRRSMAAPRQQVAGILAEIQSRRADTRAMLIKSKQLKHMVKMLAPQEKKDDSFSD